MLFMKQTRIVGIVSLIAAAVMIVAGIVTWATVSSQLADQKITVADDASMLAGAEVKGPFSAYAEAEIINEHALSSSEGKTYAELGALARQAEADGDTELAEQYTQQRVTQMNASFLRASLFTSVVAFGVSALVIGLGIMFGLMGWVFLAQARAMAAMAPVTVKESE